MPSHSAPLLGFVTLGWAEILILAVLVSILFLGPRLHQLVRGATRMPTEFLKGKREKPKPGDDSRTPKA